MSARWEGLLGLAPRGLRARARRYWSGRLLVYHHPTYRLPLAASIGGPMSPRRADDALTWAVSAGVIEPDQVVPTEELSWEDAALVHTEGYLASLDRPEVVARILGTDAARVPVRNILETWRRAAWGTLEAARRLTLRAQPHRSALPGSGLAQGRAVNLLGGFHHAERDRGGGFCAINDVAIAVARLRRDGLRGRIVVIDLDAHPPDGIVACLGNDPELEVRSISAASAWELPEAENAVVVDVRLPTGTGDGPYLEAVDALLQDLPDAVLAFYLAGSDPLTGDPLGGLQISRDGLRERDRRVLHALGPVPTVILPAGGYTEDSWRVLGETMALAAGSSRRIREGFDPHALRTRRVMRALDPNDLGGSDDDLLLTEEELFGSLGVAPNHGAEPRFLGYYTRHGLEHALTAYGYLDTLGRLGFVGLSLEIATGNGGPDRMRISAEVDGKREVLVDLSVSVRRIEGYRTLFIEWLELRDPRSPFTQHRPRLPGQQQPGLGMAEETTQLLVRAAERVDLAGVSFVPAHYHVAWIARRSFVHVDPEARGRFRALCAVLRDVPLLRATARLAGPGLETEDGRRIVWQPSEMVMSLSDGLREKLDASEPAAAAAEARWLDLLLPWS